MAWTQKVVLALTLCLTTVIIALTIVRVSGLRRGTKVDSTWETYWQFISAEIGLTMTAATAFRTFYVSQISSWQLRSPRKWLSMKSSQKSDFYNQRDENQLGDLAKVPGATITGIRTFINGGGIQTTGSTSRIMHDSRIGDVEDEACPLSSPHGIHVQRSISAISQHGNGSTM